MVAEMPPNDMIMEEARLKTFTNWPLKESVTCNAKKMAEAGFYCIDPEENPDSVQCFLCKKQLDGWEEQDDPWVEHINHAKYCLFAQCRKAENDMTVNFDHFLYNIIFLFFVQLIYFAL